MIFFPIICASLFIAIPRIISAAPVSKRVVIDNNRSDDYDKQSAWNEGETKSKDEESGNFEDNHQNPWRPQSIVQSIPQNNADAVHIERTQGYNGVDNYLPTGYEEYEEISPPLDRCSGNDCKCPEGMTGVQPFCRPVDPVNQVEPQDKCIGDSCKCPPGMVGVEPFCRPADPEGRTAVEGAPVACDSTWTNVQGETCQTYAENGWCANLGGGLGDIRRFQDLADFEGRTALVCPECGCKGETESKDEESNDYYYNPSGETESEDKGSNFDNNSGININIKINNPTSE